MATNAILSKVRKWLCLFILLTTAYLLCGCKPGQALRIGSQDLFSLGAQKSCHFSRNSLGVRISWKDKLPVTLIIGPTVPENFDADIVASAEHWNTAMKKTVIKVTRDNSFTNAPGDDKRNVIYWMTSWDSSNAQEQARTSTKSDLSLIIDADIKINGKNYVYAFASGDATPPIPSGTSIDFQSLMVHEMGHVLGLQHFDGENNVMSPYLPSKTVRVTPSSYEISELNCEY